MSKEDGEEDMLHSDEYELSQEPAHASERQLLIGVHSPITPAAQYMLRTVSAFFDLQRDGLSPGQIEMLVGVGSDADELVSVARKRHNDCIIIGSKGHSPGRRFRRWLLGSTSRRVGKLIPCPVLIVTLPRSRGSRDLVAWYEAAVLQSLHDQPATLVIFTVQEVATCFLPDEVPIIGHRESRMFELND